MSKNSFRKTAVSSFLIIAFAIAMLIGVTYAVFNDSSSTSVNTIQAGTLDVELVDADGNSLEGGTVNFTGGSNILWEPDRGYSLDTVYIKNNGDLDLQYKIIVNGIDGSDELGQWIDWSIKVGGNTVDLDTYEATLAANSTPVAIELVGTMKHNTPNSVMGYTASGIGITVIARQTTGLGEYPATPTP